MKKFLILVLSITLTFNAYANDLPTELSTLDPTLPQIAMVVQAPHDLSQTGTAVEAPEVLPTPEVTPEPAPETLVAVVPEPDPEDLRCLQQNIYYEARGEGEKGMQAVAEVTINRAKDPRYPKTVCGVVTQKAKGVCQFSWVCDRKTRGRPAPKREGDLIAWETAGKIARQVFTGTIDTLVGNATHFHTTGVRPSWAKRIERIVKIGAHIFYYERPRN